MSRGFCHLGHHLHRHDIFLEAGGATPEVVQFGVDAAQIGRRVAGEEVIEQALLLIFGPLVFRD